MGSRSTRVAASLAVAVMATACGSVTSNTEALAPAAPILTGTVQIQSPTVTSGSALGVVVRTPLPGAGAYVLSAPGIAANFQIPAPFQSVIVQNIAYYRRLSLGSPIRLAAVTVANTSRTPFSLDGFTVTTSAKRQITLHPVAHYVGAWTGAVNIVGNARAFNTGSNLLRQLPMEVPAGQTLTGLVATSEPISDIAAVSYTAPGSSTTIPLIRRSLLLHRAQVAAHQAAVRAAMLATMQANRLLRLQMRLAAQAARLSAQQAAWLSAEQARAAARRAARAAWLAEHAAHRPASPSPVTRSQPPPTTPPPTTPPPTTPPPTTPPPTTPPPTP